MKKIKIKHLQFAKMPGATYLFSFFTKFSSGINDFNLILLNRRCNVSRPGRIGALGRHVREKWWGQKKEYRPAQVICLIIAASAAQRK